MLSCKREEHGKRPNIILIMADDLGYSDIGCYGGEIRTPHLDRLAQEGIRFRQFYNSARCCPSRASLLTGLYPHQAGVGHMMSDRGLAGYKGDLNKNCVTIAEVLRQSGYSTYACGKWHVTRFNEGPKHNWPLQRGFDRYFGTITGGGNYFAPYHLIRDNDFIDMEFDSFYYTDAIADQGVNYILEHNRKESQRPFFLYIAFTSPHWPLHALEEDIAHYQGRYDKGWDVLREERYARMINMGLINPNWKLTPRDSRVPPWEEEKDKEWQARRMEVYAAQVDRMDQGIGRIVAALEKQGVLEETMILFLSDNGGCAEEITERWTNWLLSGPLKVGWQFPPGASPIKVGNKPDIMPGGPDTFQSYGVPWANVSNTPFRLYKHWVHQGGIATPLIIHWPARIKAKGRLIDQPGHLIDIMATCVDVAQASYPQSYNGESIQPYKGLSLVPTFDHKPLDREAIYFEHEGNRAVISGEWKLVA
ncbi:MAG: arylsulfatase, partial [Deltaproteobacteria bacterium]|nr:arylsulfatase [Deltaproteobacteria bacterium]